MQKKNFMSQQEVLFKNVMSQGGLIYLQNNNDHLASNISLSRVQKWLEMQDKIRYSQWTSCINANLISESFEQKN